MGWLLGIFSAFCLPAQSLDATRELARAAMARADYVQAEALWLRVAHFSGDVAPFEPAAGLAEAHFQLGKFKEAAEEFDYVARLAPQEGQRIQFTLRYAMSALQVHDFEGARAQLEALGPLEDSLLEHRRQFFLGSAAYGMDDFVMAEGYWNGCLDAPTEKARLHQLFEHNARLQLRHPKSAIAFSLFVPGLGQLLNGQPGHALNSVLLLGAIAAGGIYVGAVVGLADALVLFLPTFSRYYIGGALRAGKDAASKLQQQKDNVLREILDLLAK